MKPAFSLLARILSWFFLNMFLVAAALAVFFVFQPNIDLHAVLGRQKADRLKTAGILIANDLDRTPRTGWPGVLEKHAAIHHIDFVIVLRNGSHFSSKAGDIPEPVMIKARKILRLDEHGRFLPPPHRPGPPGRKPEKRAFNDRRDRMPPPYEKDGKHDFTMRTRQPTRYWSGILIPLGQKQSRHPDLLIAVSDSITGNGFFFDPLPWLVVAAAVILISILMWIPIVRNITHPLTRMTRATEEIAKGCFEVSIPEKRSDEIGRLARAINNMASRLSAFVNGQKRFLGDVAHELGSPIARIQFGLGALEQRIEKKNRERVADIMEDVEHLSKLVNELLAFSRADMKSNTVKLDQIELLPVVQAAIKREATPAAEIITRIDPDMRVVASAELLVRAFANLVRNAIKYAGDAGRIEITAQKRNGVIDIEVRDTGSGVPEELLDQLFEPFFRPEVSRDRDSGGVGLGLAIVKTCIETCKGSVSAANLEGGGFGVTVTLSA